MVVGPLLPSSEFPEARAAAEAQAVRMARSVREAGDRAVIAPRADPDDDAVAGHESDRVLMDELPPFHRLPALLESVRDADAATAFRAWDALQKFTAADLIECDQYPQLLPALGALLATALRRTATDDIDAARAVAVERDCMRLHVRLLDEGGAAQRAEVLIALCARTRQPAVTLSSGVQETAHEEVGENESSAAYCSLLSRARLQVLRAPDGALLHAPLRDTLLGELFALSAADTAGVRRGLAMADPTARWLAALLGRATWRTAAWRHAHASGLIERCTLACRTPPPAAEEHAHDLCCCALLLREAVLAHGEGEAVAVAWAQATLTDLVVIAGPNLAQRVSHVGHNMARMLASACDAIGAALDVLAAAPAAAPLWTAAAVAALVDPVVRQERFAARLFLPAVWTLATSSTGRVLLLAGDASSPPIQRILTYTLRVLAEKVAIGGGKHEGAALELLIPTLVETLQSPAAAARLVPALLELHAAATCHGSASTPPLLLFPTLRLLSATFSGVSALPASAVALLSTEVARAEAAQGSATIGTVASLVSSGAEGLIALAQAGVAWRRVQGFVEAAQTPGGCNELHSPPVAGQATPLLVALSRVLLVTAWPHAVPLALAPSADADVASGGSRGGMALRAAFALVMSKLVLFSAERGSRERHAPHNAEEAPAAALLMLIVLCGDVEASLLLRRRFALVSHLQGLDAEAVTSITGPLTVDAPDDRDGVAGVAHEGEIIEMVAEPHDAQLELISAPRSPEAADSSSATAAEATDSMVDLNCVCRARLLSRLLQWGVSSEWALPHGSLSCSPLFPLARPPATDCTPLEPAAASDSAEEAESLRRCIADADNRRVRSAAPLILGRGAAPALRALCRALRRHESSALHDACNNTEADVEVKALPPLCPAAAGAPPPVLPAHCHTGALLAIRYLQRVHAAGGSLRVEDTAAFLAAVGTADGAPSGCCCFDSFALVSLALMMDASEAHATLRLLAEESFSALLWPRRAERLRSLRGPVWRWAIPLVEEMVEAELPLVHAALRRTGVPLALPLLRWLSQSWLNVLRWEDVCAATLLPLLLGADYLSYICFAAVSHAAPALHERADSGDLLVYMLQEPLAEFGVADALPLMQQMRRRWRPRCIAAMRQAMQE